MHKPPPRASLPTSGEKLQDSIGWPGLKNIKHAATVAKKVVEKAVANLPRVFGRVLVFGAGKLAGGLISVAATLVAPTPTGKVLVWDAKQGSLFVKYVVINPE